MEQILIRLVKHDGTILERHMFASSSEAKKYIKMIISSTISYKRIEVLDGQSFRLPLLIFDEE